MFSTEEKQQYNRHFILDAIGTEGQTKLKNSKVLVVGAGGLGCAILQYLTAAGVGTIGIIDHDTVDQSNLQRQILFSIATIGEHKSRAAAESLTKLNPFVNFKTYIEKLTSKNALELFQNYDIIVDGSDNFQTRYLTNDAALLSNMPLVFGAIFKFEGQVSVFNYKDGPTYRCLFPKPPSENSIPNCSDVGVLGVLPGIIGCLQANETIKMICEIGDVLSGKLLSFNALNLQQNILKFKKNPAIVIEKLIDYDLFCGIKKENDFDISTSDLRNLLSTDLVSLIDVRKRMEREHFNIGGIHIPLHEIHQKIDSFSELENIVLYCEVGQRSRIAAKILKEKYPHKNIKSLQNGIVAWKKTKQ